MPKFVPVDTNKRVNGLKLPKNLQIEKLTSVVDPFENPWKTSPFVRHNWFNKLRDSQIKKIKLPSPGENLPRVFQYCADQGGCAFWRLIFPGNELLANNKAVIQTLYQMLPDPRTYHGISAVILQRQCARPQVDFIKHLRMVSDEFKKQGQPGFRIIYELDDVVLPASLINDFNLCKTAFTDPDIEKNVKEIMTYVDEMVVPSRYMADHYKKHLDFKKISVIPNYVPRYWFDKNITVDDAVENYRKNRDKPRILYAGSSTHFDIGNLNGQVDDFYHVNSQIIHDLEVNKKYQWVFVGGFPYALKKYIDNGQIEYHGWTSMTEYPRLLASTRANVMLAPLRDNPFNRSKANIKLTEGAALCIPTIAQNLDCYNADGWPFLFDTGDQMMQQIENILKDEESFRSSVEKAKSYVDRYWLGEHLQEWVNLYTTNFGDPRRKEQTDFYERNKSQFE
jgi:hypothetical protein